MTTASIRAAVERIVLCSGQGGLRGDGAAGRTRRGGRRRRRSPWSASSSCTPGPTRRSRRCWAPTRAQTEVVWLQEEPENMGAWTFVHGRLHSDSARHSSATSPGRVRQPGDRQRARPRGRAGRPARSSDPGESLRSDRSRAHRRRRIQHRDRGPVTAPASRQLEEAVASSCETIPMPRSTVIVDATFAHRIDPAELTSSRRRCSRASTSIRRRVPSGAATRSCSGRGEGRPARSCRTTRSRSSTASTHGCSSGAGSSAGRPFPGSGGSSVPGTRCAARSPRP